MSESMATVRLAHPTGLHARPAVKFMQLAKTFAAAVEVQVEGRSDWVDAKSIVRVMGLKARRDETLAIRADGADAKNAVGALVGLVRRDFHESA